MWQLRNCCENNISAKVSIKQSEKKLEKIVLPLNMIYENYLASFFYFALL